MSGIRKMFQGSRPLSPLKKPRLSTFKAFAMQIAMRFRHSTHLTINLSRIRTQCAFYGQQTSFTQIHPSGGV